MKCNVIVLGSSSAGNCTVIADEKNAILFDCGFPLKYINFHLSNLNLTFDNISAVFISHIHTDHYNQFVLKRLLESNKKVFCSPKVKKILTYKFPFAMENESNIIDFTNESLVEKFKVKSFEVPHDSEGGCYGFNIFFKNSLKEKKISIATDIGYPQKEHENHFLNSDLMIIESNHDTEMLENSGRPWFLINRIKEIGHLSNLQCAEFVGQVLQKSVTLPSHIILAHISKDCNKEAVALKTMRTKLDEISIKNIVVIASKTNLPTKVINL